ncbi:MAG: hypothetical protein Q7T73_04390 [Beijerinckiaceae bacterium]|jgi:hypothetical protein|nr:hypothetical protein [Beijerinckiaceae bacterium]
MAELSVADKRAIHGDNYEAIEAREAALARAPEGPEERRRALIQRLEINETGRISAFAIALTGILLAIGSWYRTGTIDIAGMIGIAGFAIGVVWYIWLVNSAKQWRAKLQDK